jgi:DNA-binding IclR family transcriptional regulator
MNMNQAPQSMETDRQFAINLSRGLQVLRAFTPSDYLLGNRELCEKTGLPKATISRLTYTLDQLGYLTRIDRLQKYRLGPGVLMLGYPMLASMEIRHLARPHIEKLAAQTGWTVNLGMLGKLEVVYIDALRIDRGNFLKPDIGSARPLLTTALGRALLFASHPAQRDSILNRLKIEDSAQYAADFPYYEKDRSFYEKNGFCLSRGDWKRNVLAVAVPLNVASDDHLQIGMNCTISTARLTKAELLKNIIPYLFEARHNIERDSGKIVTPAGTSS